MVFLVRTSLLALLFSNMAFANSLDEWAKNEVSKNLRNNQVLLQCDSVRSKEEIQSTSSVLNVGDEVVTVETVLDGCEVKKVISEYHYHLDIVSVKSITK